MSNSGAAVPETKKLVIFIQARPLYLFAIYLFDTADVVLHAAPAQTRIFTLEDILRNRKLMDERRIVKSPNLLQMKTINALITSFILSILTISLTASLLEDGDVNAISMYFVVFLGPIVLVLLLNAIVLAIAKRAKSLGTKRWLTAAPILILIVLAIPSDIRIPGVDGSLSFLGMVGLVAVGITNVVWNIKASERSE